MKSCAVENLIGKRFGKLIVVSQDKNDKYNHIQYFCKCDCGNSKVVLKSSLVRGFTKSCGCYYNETRKTSALKHGKTNTRIYAIWASMNERCANKSNKDFKYYGAKGIVVCDEWKDFQRFYDWAIKNGYSEKLTIDRIDSSKNYEPTNCRWATRLTQANNTERNHYVEHNGERHTVSEWSRILGKSQRTIYDRLKRGLTEEVAIFN